MGNIIKTVDLIKQYNHFPVLKGLNMTVEKGDVYGFLGRNGCGKTTTMNILCNIIQKDGGTVELGENNQKIKIGYLPESPSFFPYMNAYEYLSYIAACLKYDGDIKMRNSELLSMVGLEQAGRRKVKGYSRGMQQRLGIATAMYDNPDLLILDEPTSALDPEGRVEVMNIIYQLAKSGTTILLCTHILSDVERVANKIGILSNGVMVMEGKIQDILHQHSSGQLIVELYNTSGENVNLLLNSGLCPNIYFDERRNTFYFNTETPEQLSADLMQFLAQHQIAAKNVVVYRPTLEEIYMKAVNGNV